VSDPTTLPAPGPSGYQPSPGEGIEDVTITVERDGVTIQAGYLFPTVRPTGEALQAIAELRDALTAMLVTKVAAPIPPVATPVPPAPDPASTVRPPTGGAVLVDAPTQVAQQPAPFPGTAPTLDAMRAGAWGNSPSQPATTPAGPTWQQGIDQINTTNMGPNPAF
jgi:hypothetical protein